MSEFLDNQNLPEAPAKVFMVGLGGLGMSGLAQLLRWEGYAVAGSDRGLDEPGKAELYRGLRRQGIFLYPQDGSGVRAFQPDVIIRSTAIEPGNPDLEAGAGVPLVHRARALSQALSAVDADLIAVAGSCGKTSVTGWVASALRALGEAVLDVNGGYNAGIDPDGMPGNFHVDPEPRWLVAEVDESDRSIAEFAPAHGILLNVGNDHYSKEELRQVFAAFLKRCQKGAAIVDDLRELAGGLGIPVQYFAPARDDASTGSDSSVLSFENYHTDATGISFDVTGMGHVHSTQSGRHSASNALAVLALLRNLGLGKSDEELCRAIESFPGIRQRFEVVGHLGNGTPLVNDYAHNPEKLTAAISTARERFGTPLFLVWQPHGFAPLKFMREELVEALAKLLQPQDRFVMLPVYYAGGSASFSPTSAEVVKDLTTRGLPAIACDRPHAEALLHAGKYNAVVVMGARDSSLRDWTIGL